MKVKFGKIMKVIIIIAILLISLSNIAEAAVDWKSKIDSFDAASGALDTPATKITSAIISAVRIVATGVAIIMLAFVAMKYMASAPGDRAEIKKHAVVYVVGAIVLFGSSGILSILQKFATNINAA